MSPNKRNTSEPSRPRKASTKRQRRAFKQRKIPIILQNVPLCYYGVRMDDVFSGDATIQHPVVSESVAPLHVTTPQDTDTPYLASYFRPADSQIPVSERCLNEATRVYRGTRTEPSYVPIPFHCGPDFNTSQPEDNILSVTNDLYPNNDRLGSCDFIPPSTASSSTGSLSMDSEYCDDWYLEQWLDLSMAFPGSSYDSDLNDIMMYAGTSGSSESESQLTMTLTNDGITLPFPNDDANNPHNSYYYM